MRQGFILGLFLALSSWAAAQDIDGFWKTIDRKTRRAQCIIAVYDYQGKSYGRIIGTFNNAGQMDDSIYAPKKRAPGVVGNPFYSGMDIIWGLHKRNTRYKGKILDPEKGNVYTAELWIQGGNLIVRGELLFFGRNETWLPAANSDFPSGFKKPDVSQFVPVIPQVN